MKTLYQRLGAQEGITAIANDLVDLHYDNPKVAPRYDMVTTHRGMNISAEELVAVLDDTLLALERNGVGQREQEEVLYILYGMRSEIIGV